MKPIDEGKLDKMLSKFNTLKTIFQKELDWAALEENLENKYKTSFLVPTGNGIKKIEISDAICFFSDANASFILTNQNRQFVVTSSLDSLEQQLQPKQFFRISRKYIINKKYISSFTNNSQTRLQISGLENLEFIVSRLKTKLFLEWYKK